MPSLDKVGNVSAKSVIKHTGKDWAKWVSALDKCGGRMLSHQELVALLKKKFRLSIWWQQEVARGYHIATGKRIAQQTLKGTYTTTATKTIPLPAKKVFAFLISIEGIELWLHPLSPTKIKAGQAYERMGGVFGEIRTYVPGKKFRLTWIDEDWPRKTTVQVHVVPKPQSKCMLVIDHLDLPTLKAKSEMHRYWRQVVDQIAQIKLRS